MDNNISCFINFNLVVFYIKSAIGNYQRITKLAVQSKSKRSGHVKVNGIEPVDVNTGITMISEIC